MDSLPVNYRPYQSKRHSRSHSSISVNSTTSSLRATSPLSRQLSATGSELSPPGSLTLGFKGVEGAGEREGGGERKWEPVFLEEEDEKRLSDRIGAPTTVQVVITPEPKANGMNGTSIEEKGKSASFSLPGARQSPPPPKASPPPSSTASMTSASPPPSVHSTQSLATSAAGGPSTPERPQPVPRPSSTFRHVPLRGRGGHTPSPLRPGLPPVTRSFQAPPPSAGGKATTTGGPGRVEPGRTVSQPVIQLRSQPSSSTAPAFGPQASAPPPPPPKDNPSNSQARAAPAPITFGRSASSIALVSPPSSSAPTPSLLSTPSRALSPSPSPLPVPAPAPSPAPTLPSASHSATSTSFQHQQAQQMQSQHARQTPYRAGFQPKPLYRIRTEEFLEVRGRVSDSRKGEDRRLERRLEKLIQLHFAPKPSSSNPPALPRSTSLLNELKGAAAQEAAEIRAAEQRIAPWEPDASVRECRLCSTPFNALTVRKHHCRLCGTIICSQPPNPKSSSPARRLPCSVLIAADYKTGRVWDVKEGIAYGVQPRGVNGVGVGKGGSGGAGGAGAGGGGKEEEKGVRVCRECREKVRRIQYVLERSKVPAVARLYEVLLQLEQDLSSLSTTYTDLLLSLPSPPTAAALAPAQETRKLILDTCADYDKVARRILELPAVKGGEGERVQRAVWMRSRGVLQREMGGLPALPKLPSHKKSKSTHSHSLPGSGTHTPSTPQADKDAELAHRLQPLLEQEALLDQYVAEATAARKFEDARALRQSLEEIREEVGRLVREWGG